MNKIVDRIRKFIALSENNNSPEEAAAAAAAAQELMFKYQIGEADLDLGSDTKREAEEVVDESVLVDDKVKRDVWKASLANQLAHAFGCKMYTWRDWQTKECRYRVVGVKSVVQTIGYMFTYLAAEIDRLADEAWKVELNKKFQSARTWKNSFRLGAVNTIAGRLKAQRAEQDAQVEAMVAAAKEARAAGAAETVKTTALALYKTDQERVQDEYKKISKAKGLRTSRSAYRRHSVSAYEKGQAAGSKVGLGGGKGLGAPATQIP